jgi:nucleolar protein 56
LGLVRRSILAGSTVEQDLLQAMEALDNLSQAINLLDERLYEWSRLHSQEIVHGKDLAEGLKEDENMGTLARAILSLRESRKATETDVSATVQALAPNLSTLAGPVLAARLISRAGGLSNLAKMPSSRVQVMGAEKSLFKHLRGHAPSPKHGIIFRHPAVIGSAKKLRGRVARTLAAKLAIAARLDHFGAGLSLDLQASLEARLKDIKQRGRNKGK